jgi:hypothetical protein
MHRIYSLNIEQLRNNMYHLFGTDSSIKIADWLKENTALPLVFYLFKSG